MYTQKEINKALKLYERLGSMRKVIRVLGYPAKATLISWLAEKKQTGKVLPKNGMGRKSLLPVEEQGVWKFLWAAPGLINRCRV